MTVLEARRGRPSFVSVAALREQNALLRADARMERTETLVYAGRVKVLGHRIDRQISDGLLLEGQQAAAEIVVLSDRRIRQLGGDAA